VVLWYIRLRLCYLLHGSFFSYGYNDLVDNLDRFSINKSRGYENLSLENYCNRALIC
jgi:hypothetical protein